jgi:hypothetical protein
MWRFAKEATGILRIKLRSNRNLSYFSTAFLPSLLSVWNYFFCDGVSIICNKGISDAGSKQN